MEKQNTVTPCEKFITILSGVSALFLIVGVSFIPHDQLQSEGPAGRDAATPRVSATAAAATTANQPADHE